MFERFTEKAIQVIILSQEETRRLGHNFIGTEIILLGLIAEESGVAAKVLQSMGVTLETARKEVENIIGKGSGFVSVEVPFTPKAKRMLELANEESSNLTKNVIDTEHILLGLIRIENGVACKVLEKLGVVISQIRPRVLRMLENEEYEVFADRFAPRTNQNLALISGKVEVKFNRLMAMLTAAKELIGEIENEFFKREPVSGEDWENAIAQLPKASAAEQPGLKEYLTELQAALQADSNLNADDKIEALEPLLVLAIAGQNLTEASLKKFAKTAIKILKGTITELPETSEFVEACNRLLPQIAVKFGLQ